MKTKNNCKYSKESLFNELTQGLTFSYNNNGELLLTESNKKEVMSRFKSIMERMRNER